MAVLILYRSPVSPKRQCNRISPPFFSSRPRLQRGGDDRYGILRGLTTCALHAGRSPNTVLTLLMPMSYSVSSLLRLSALMISLAIPPALHAQSTGADIRQKAWKKRKVSEQQDSEFVNFGQWKEVAQFIDDMVARNGFDRAELNKVFSQVQYTDTAIR